MVLIAVGGCFGYHKLNESRRYREALTLVHRYENPDSLIVQQIGRLERENKIWQIANAYALVARRNGIEVDRKKLASEIEETFPSALW